MVEIVEEVIEMNIIFLPSVNDFTPDRKKYLRKIIRKAARRASAILGIKEGVINITIYPFTHYVRGKSWVVGVAQSKEWLQLTIPPEVYTKSDLLGTIYHEMHHMARGYCILHSEIERQGSLLDSIFSEGLATTFEMEQIAYTPAYSRYNVTEIEAWLPKLREEMWKINYDHQSWFFENGEQAWIGYKIGKYLVDQIIKNNPTYDSVKLVNTNAEKLLKLSEIII